MLGTGVRCLQLQVLPPSALTIHHIPSGWFQFLFLLLSVLIERSWAGGYDRGTVQPWHLSAAAGRGVPPPLPPPSPPAAEAATTCCRASNRWRGGRQGHCHKEGKQHHHQQHSRGLLQLQLEGRGLVAFQGCNPIYGPQYATISSKYPFCYNGFGASL